MLQFLNTLDRRWIFLLMLLAVAVPVLLKLTPPERPSPAVRKVFDAVENLPSGSTVLLSLDYDPASEAELKPMATAFLRHCCRKRHKMILLTVWQTGLPLLNTHVREVIEEEFASAGFRYGEDYVNLGYRPGLEVAIKSIATDFRKTCPNDIRGTSIDELPILNPIRQLQDVKLILNVSAGYPGTKEWIQYGTTTHRIPIASGCTGVQGPQLFPYMPDQLIGLLAALKGAAEYEAALGDKYEAYRDVKFQSARQRMGPQLWAHVLIIGLMLLGNTLHLINTLRGDLPVGVSR